MAQASAGDITGRLVIDTSDLARLRSESARTAQALKNDLGKSQAAPVSNQAIDSIRTARTEVDRFGRTHAQVFNDIRGAVNQYQGGMNNARAATVTLNGAMSVLQQSAAALGVSLTAAAAIQFVRSALAGVGALQDLSEQTGIAADRLAALQPIAENAGSSIQEVANGVRALMRSMVEGAPDVVAAMRDLGISTERMLELTADPAGAIDAISSGLLKLENQGKSTATIMEIMSRAGFRLAPVLREVGRAGGLMKLESPLTAAEIAAVDEAGDALNRMYLKAQALAAVGFVEVKNNLNGLIEYAKSHPIEFVLKFIGGAPGELLGRAHEEAERIRAVAAARQGANIGAGGVGAGLSGGASGAPKETKFQTEFKASLDDTIKSLESQKEALIGTKEASIELSIGILRAKAATLGFAEGNVELEKRLNQIRDLQIELAQSQFADQILKQNQAIQVQIVGMTQGAAAAEQLALRYQQENANLAGLNSTALAAIDAQKRLNDERAKAVVPQIERQQKQDETAIIRKSQVLGDLGITVNVHEEIRQSLVKELDAAIKAAGEDIRAEQPAMELAVRIVPRLEALSLSSIQKELSNQNARDAGFAGVLNKTFTNTFDTGAAKVNNLEAALRTARDRGLLPFSQGVQELGEQLDQARFDEAFGGIQRDLRTAAAEAQVFGQSFDLGAARVAAIENGLRNLIRQGLDPANAKVQELVGQLQNARVDAVFGDLAKTLENASKEAEVLGGAVDLNAVSIDALTNAIKKLIADGLDPLDPRIQQLKKELEDAKAVERWSEAFSGMADAAVQAINDLANGGKIKDVLRNFAARISSEITRALVTKPIEDWIKQQMNEIAKVGIGKTIENILGGKTPEKQLPKVTDKVPTVLGQPDKPGGVAGDAGVAAIQAQQATTEAAIQALSAEAMASIQAGETGLQVLATEAQTAITTAGTTAQTGIEATSTTAQGAIEAVKVAALAAIQAAKNIPATGGGGGIPFIGSLGGSTGGETFLGGVTDIVPTTLGGAAGGADMFANDARLVGEHGPEVWRPAKAGSVLPMYKFMMEQSQQREAPRVTMNISTPDASSFRRAERSIVNRARSSFARMGD